MNDRCGCCEGIERVTPELIVNRPGLDAISYRVGTHATFFQTMLARLSSMEVKVGEDHPSDEYLTHLRDRLRWIDTSQHPLAVRLRSFLSEEIRDRIVRELQASGSGRSSSETTVHIAHQISEVMNSDSFFDQLMGDEMLEFVLLSRVVYEMLQAPALDVEKRRAVLQEMYQQAAPSAFGSVIRPLERLGTRDSRDPIIAMLDAWSTVGDVLTFYQERIANEGFLRTATQRRSILELGKLVGYRLHPGVAASTYLAFKLDPGFNVTIPAGTGARSVPADKDEQPQVFETSEDVMARSDWNELRPRQTRPTLINPGNVKNVDVIFFEGVSTKLKSNDYLVFEFEEDVLPQLRKVDRVEEEPELHRTKVTLQLERFSATSFENSLRQEVAFAQQRNRFVTPLQTPDLFSETYIGQTSSLSEVLDLYSGSGLVVLDKQVAVWLDRADWKNHVRTISEAKDYAEEIAGIAASARADLSSQLTEEGRELVHNYLARLPKYLDNDELKAEFESLKNTLAGLTGTKTELLEATQTALDEFDPSTDPDLLLLKAAITSFRNKFDEVTHTDITNEEYKTHVNLIVTFAESIHRSLAENRPAIPPDAATKWSPEIEKSIDAVDDLKDVQTRINTAEAELTVIAEFAHLTEKITEFNHEIENSHRAIERELRTIINGISGVTIPSNEDEIDPDEIGREIKDIVDLLTDISGDNLVQLVARTETGVENFAELLKKSTPFATAYLAFSQDVAGFVAEIEKLRADLRQLFTDKATAAITEGHSAMEELNVPVEQQEIRRDALQALARLNELLNATQTGPDFLERLRDLVSDALITGLDDGAGGTTKPIQELADIAPRRSDLQALIEQVRQRLDALVKQVEAEEVIPPIPIDTFNRDLAGLKSIQNLATRAGVDVDQLSLDLAQALQGDQFRASDILAKILATLGTGSRDELYALWRSLPPRPGQAKCLALRIRAPMFGYNASPKAITPDDLPAATPGEVKVLNNEWPVHLVPATDPNLERANRVYLDNEYEGILPGSYLVIENSELEPRVYRAEEVALRPRKAYGMSSKTTIIQLGKGQTWWNPVDANASDGDKDITKLRDSIVHAQTEELTIAEESLDYHVGERENAVDSLPEKPNEIDLDQIVYGFESARRLVLTGEPTDRPGVVESEFINVLNVQHVWRKPPGEVPRTRLVLAKPLSKPYRRETVVIYGNTAPATHGATQKEILGNGNATAFQRFQLPGIAYPDSALTYVSAPTERGTAISLRIRVDGIEWNQRESLIDVDRDETVFVTDTNNQGNVFVAFGDGSRGSRLPSGLQNVEAQFRAGIGPVGNLPENRVTQLIDQPTGVSSVTNPVKSSGGAAPEATSQARDNTTLGIASLDRLVSLVDYEEFARNFAGISQASARMLTNLGRRVVHVSVASAGDEPFDVTADVLVKLRQAFLRNGDSIHGVVVEPADTLLLIFSANLRISQGYEFQNVERVVRTSLLDRFGYANQRLARSVQLSDLISLIQRTPGVEFVDVDSFSVIDDEVATDQDDLDRLVQDLRRRQRPSACIPVRSARVEENQVRAAELACLTPEVPETLILSELLT